MRRHEFVQELDSIDEKTAASSADDSDFELKKVPPLPLPIGPPPVAPPPRLLMDVPGLDDDDDNEQEHVALQPTDSEAENTADETLKNAIRLQQQQQEQLMMRPHERIVDVHQDPVNPGALVVTDSTAYNNFQRLRNAYRWANRGRARLHQYTKEHPKKCGVLFVVVLIVVFVFVIWLVQFLMQ